MPTPPPRISARSKRQPLTRSQMMGRIRSKNTRPEILVRAAVHALGPRFRKHVDDLPGKPDLANKARRWAIFVLGCFWHSHSGCQLASVPKSNVVYWADKLARDPSRDTAKIAALRTSGFRVLVVWECDVRNGSRMEEQIRQFFHGAAGNES